MKKAVGMKKQENDEMDSSKAAKNYLWHKIDQKDCSFFSDHFAMCYKARQIGSLGLI